MGGLAAPPHRRHERLRRALHRGLLRGRRKPDLAPRDGGQPRRLLRGLLQLAPPLPDRRRRRPAAAVAPALAGRHPAADRLRPGARRVRPPGGPVPPGRERHLLLQPLPGRSRRRGHRGPRLPLRRPLHRPRSRRRQLGRRPQADPLRPQRLRRRRPRLLRTRPLVRLVGGHVGVRAPLPRRARRRDRRRPEGPGQGQGHGRRHGPAHGTGRRRAQPRRGEPGDQRLAAHRRGPLPRLGPRLRRPLGRAGPGQRRPAAGQRRPLRGGGGAHGRQVARRPLRLDLAPRVLQRAAGGPAGRRGRPAHDRRHIVAGAAAGPAGPHLRDGRDPRPAPPADEPPPPLDRPLAGPGARRPPRHLGRPLPVRRRRLVRLAAPLPHLPGGPVEPVHGPGGLAPHRGAARPGGLRLGRRLQLPQQGGRRPRAAVAALPGRGPTPASPSACSAPATARSPAAWS